MNINVKQEIIKFHEIICKFILILKGNHDNTKYRNSFVASKWAMGLDLNSMKSTHKFQIKKLDDEQWFELFLWSINLGWSKQINITVKLGHQFLEPWKIFDPKGKSEDFICQRFTTWGGCVLNSSG